MPYMRIQLVDGQALVFNKKCNFMANQVFEPSIHFTENGFVTNTLRVDCSLTKARVEVY
jgi:hypothetical protein